MNIAASIPEKDRVASSSDELKERGPVQRVLSFQLPFGDKLRNGLALFLFVSISLWFWQSLTALYRISQAQEHYSHIVLIPWVSAYVLYLQRKTILSSREWCPWVGGTLIGAGIGWSWYLGRDGTAPDLLSMSAMAWIVACWGVFLLSYGVEAARRNTFALLFLLCMVPLPEQLLNAIIVFLQRSSAEATAILFSVLGVPTFRDGFIFSLSNFTIHVAEECSGIRSFLSLIITVLVAGHFFLRSLWAKLGIVAFVIPMAIIKNAFRIVGLTLLANYVDPKYITDSILHRSGGIPLFVLSLVVLFSFIWLLRRIETRLGYGSGQRIAYEDQRL